MTGQRRLATTGVNNNATLSEAEPATLDHTSGDPEISSIVRSELPTIATIPLGFFRGLLELGTAVDHPAPPHC